MMIRRIEQYIIILLLGLISFFIGNYIKTQQKTARYIEANKNFDILNAKLRNLILINSSVKINVVQDFVNTEFLPYLSYKKDAFIIVLTENACEECFNKVISSFREHDMHDVLFLVMNYPGSNIIKQIWKENDFPDSLCIYTKRQFLVKDKSSILVIEIKDGEIIRFSIADTSLA